MAVDEKIKDRILDNIIIQNQDDILEEMSKNLYDTQ